MRLVVIGTGYVGLVSGTCFAELGYDVTCVDSNEAKIAGLHKGELPIYEPGLDDMVARNVEAGRLRFSTNTAEAVQGADIISIAVGTPTRAQDGFADLSYVHNAARDIAKALTSYALIVTKSTVPAGTGDELKRIISEINPSLEFDVASNPEFLREGNAIEDFLHPDRIVIGTDTPRAEALLQQLYQPFAQQGVAVIATDIISAELIKYAANAFLATKVSFINEMADLAEKVGGNIEDIARGMGTDSRIGPKFLAPGPGYGGSCFPKDTLAMVTIGERALSPITIVEAVIAVNRARPHRMIAKIAQAAGGDVRGKQIALLGLTFKPNTDDVRDSTAIIIAEELARNGANVVAYDPQGIEGARELLGNRIAYADSIENALKGADLAVLATEWDEFRALTPEQLSAQLAQPVLVDLRNIFDPATMQQAGFTYYSLGRKPVLVRKARDVKKKRFEAA
jgi:UDPglucose 6-dehydrogenase